MKLMVSNHVHTSLFVTKLKGLMILYELTEYFSYLRYIKLNTSMNEPNIYFKLAKTMTYWSQRDNQVPLYRKRTFYYLIYHFPCPLVLLIKTLIHITTFHCFRHEYSRNIVHLKDLCC